MQDSKEVNAENPLVYMLWSSLFLRFVTVEDSDMGNKLLTRECMRLSRTNQSYNEYFYGLSICQASRSFHICIRHCEKKQEHQKAFFAILG